MSDHQAPKEDTESRDIAKRRRRNSSRVIERLSDVPSAKVSFTTGVLSDEDTPTHCSLF